MNNAKARDSREMDTDQRLVLLSSQDNVFVICAPVKAGEDIMVSGRSVRVSTQIGLGHKIARRPIASGEKVLKYGAPIGSATQDIAPGDHVHLHNLKSDYTATHSLEEARAEHEGGEG